jgi:hypothetical protein
MMTQVINIQTIFVTFTLTYNQAKAHNMLLTMFDPHFKNMKILQNFIGHTIALQIVIEYDTNIFYPFLLHVLFI